MADGVFEFEHGFDLGDTKEVADIFAGADDDHESFVVIHLAASEEQGRKALCVAQLNHGEVNDEGFDGWLTDDEDLAFDFGGEHGIKRWLLERKHYKFVILFYREAHGIVA